MQERRFIAFYFLAVYTAFTAFQIVCLCDAQNISGEDEESSNSTSSSSSRPEAEEELTTEVGKPKLVGDTLNAESQLSESAANKETLKATYGTVLPSTSSYISLYSLTRDGNPCILLQVDASVTFTYKTKSGDDREKSEYLPAQVETSGDCKEEDAATFNLKWESYVLRWSFAKTPGRERWYVNDVKLSISITDKLFQNVNRQGPRLLKTPKSPTMLFPTPVGKSYSCQSETSVELRDGDVSATVFLRGFKLQPFISKKDFGPVYECSPGGGFAFRDETAPIAVGSTLAIVVLLTVTGYGVYRYVKIKKVQYDTME